MQGGEGKTTEMDTTPAPAGPSVIPGTHLHVIPPQGVTMEDFSKTGYTVMDLTESADEPASVGNVGGQASQPQGAAGSSKAGAQIRDEELNARLLLFKCLDKMNNDQNILEDAYYKCVEIVRGVVKEVSADLDDMENAYVAAIMKALGSGRTLVPRLSRPCTPPAPRSGTNFIPNSSRRLWSSATRAWRPKRQKPMDWPKCLATSPAVLGKIRQLTSWSVPCAVPGRSSTMQPTCSAWPSRIAG